MKKRLLIIQLIFIILLICVSCGKDNSREGRAVVSQSEETNNSFSCYYSDFYTEKYVLYHNNHGRLQIFDTESKSDTVFCFDAGCEHLQEKRDIKTNEIIQKGCISFQMSSDCVMLHDDRLFFLQDDGKIISADLRGEDRKVVTEIPIHKLSLHNVFYSSEEMFISYASDEKFEEVIDENGQTQLICTGELSDCSECGIYCINLESGTRKEIFRESDYNARINRFDIRGNHLYFVYFYLDMPYIGPDLETFGRDVKIPDWLTKDNYWDVMPKHQFIDVYDYNISTGEINCIVNHIQSEPIVFCNDFYAIAEEDGKTGLYRYSGELIRKLDFRIYGGFRSDTGLICRSEEKIEEYLYIDANTGEILKRVANDDFLPRCFIGQSVWGSCTREDGSIGPAYIHADDFWKGDFSKAVCLKYK